MADSFLGPQPQPNQLIPVPVGTPISPIIAPFVTPQPLIEPAQVTPNEIFARLPAGPQPAPPPTARLTGAAAQRLDRNYQRNLTTLENKYRELSPLIARTSPAVRQSLIDYDARRVARGSAPLTREQTVLALQTAETGEQATPEAERSPFDFFGNVAADLGDILRAIPRLPTAIRAELEELPQMQQQIAQARARGVNPLTAILQAPGVRMVPGAYVAGAAAAGDFGELARHPLMTALDVLPAGHMAAAGSRVGRAARAAQIAQAAETGRHVARPRPISAVLTSRLTPEGALARNRLGEAVDVVREETRFGQALEAFGGRTARQVARVGGKLDQRLKSLILGHGTPATAVEEFGPRIAGLFDRWSDKYPSLARNAVGPEHNAWRATFYRDLQRNPSNWDPAFVDEIRNLQVDIARYTQGLSLLDLFDGEWYPADIARKLQAAEARVGHTERMMAFRDEYVNPSGRLSPEWFRGRADEIVEIGDMRMRMQQTRAFEQTLDAYGVDVSLMSGERARLHLEKGAWEDWHRQVVALVDDPNLTLAPRRSLTDMTATLRQMGADRQATLLERAIRTGDRNEVTARLKNLYERKVPNVALDDAFRADARSMSRRLDFDRKVGKQFSAKRLAQHRTTLEQRHAANAPARFHALLADRVVEQGGRRLRSAAEAALGRRLSAEEAGAVARAVEERAWRDIPGVDEATVVDTMQTLEREVVATWRDLRAAGHDPVFIHKVSPERAQVALHSRIGPVARVPSQAKERVLDLTPDVQDLQVSLTHQAAELLAREYSTRFVEEVVDLVGVTEAQLRDRVRDSARWRARVDPQLDVEGHLQQTIKRGYERFNPDAEGFSWGGARLDKYRQEAVYIPKAIANNLKAYTPKTSLFSAITDPVTKAFRYQVIGLSPSIIINNFFSNSIAMMAESGLGPWRHWPTAREWLRDPSKIPNEELKALVLAEAPHLEHLGRERWLSSRAGQKFMSGFNSGHAFMDSAAFEAMQSGKRALDGVVQKSLEMQRWGDNVYRVMQYLDELDRGQVKQGLTVEQATGRAMELVRETFVDYAAFTPIERSALRTVIPFYSYMSHAARFVARYPLNHPVRASVQAAITRAEKERLGALPGSFLAMVPFPGFLDRFTDEAPGEQTFLDAHRLFNPFDDTADLLSIAGWVSATNPTIQVLLEQIGVVRGEAELYPTRRYDPETGRMRSVRPNLLESVMSSVFPRAGPVASLLGLSTSFNELQARDPDAALRSLAAQAGIPRLWREFNIPQEMFRAEVGREQSANLVLNEALRTGDWSEALRYPSLRPYFDQLQQLTPAEVAAMQPAAPEDIAAQITQLTGG